MKTIKERAFDIIEEVMTMDDLYSRDEVVMMLERMAEEQKAIDEAYFADVSKILNDKACNVFCHIGCPHKTDSFDCLNNKCDTWKIFKRMLEE